MRDQLRDLLSSVDADYADLRFETRHDTLITCSGRDLTQVGSSRGDGYVLRVLAGGGMASVVFSKRSDAGEAIATAVRNARLIGRHTDRPVTLAPAEPVVGTFRPELIEDPRKVSLEEKVDLVRAMNDLPHRESGIATTNTRYVEIIRDKHFVSTEGAAVSEELVTIGLAGEIVARDGDLSQNVRIGVGGANGFQNVRHEEAHVLSQTKLALDLLRARPVEGGTYDCILNPKLAGVFAHEAFGHFSEADIIEALPAMREKMQLGERLGSDVLSIVDDPTRPDQLGFYHLDDEGVAGRRTQLMKDGVLTGRLHSRRTAAAFGEPVSGHHIAEDYRFAPIIRMGCIYIEPSAVTEEELFAQLGDGLYIVDPKGGQTAGETFSFGAQSAWEVRNGRRAALLRDLNISGNLYQTMRDIKAVGNDLEMSRTGGCGKGQLNPRSCLGSPHILVRNLLVGGV